MIAFTVCVDYADILELTAEKNRHHFAEWLIVTTPDDEQTISLCSRFALTPVLTNCFYDDGADFNKWKGLNIALSSRKHLSCWFAVLDADVVWPRTVDQSFLKIGRLYTPQRRMYPSIQEIPAESEWLNHRPVNEEFAGFTQIFHSSDPRSRQSKSSNCFYDENWRHAGGADTFFQQRWPDALKVRPPFTVLHLGDDGKNWCGRTTAYRDGKMPVAAEDRRAKMESYKLQRQRKPRHIRYEAEKL